MTTPGARRRSHSLMWRLTCGLVLVSLLAAVTTALLLWREFEGANKRVRERTQLGQTKLIEQSLTRDDQGAPTLPPSLVDTLTEAAIRFAIVDADERVLIGSQPEKGPLEPLGAKTRARDFFIIKAEDGFGVLYGLSRKIALDGRPYWIQVASRDEEMHVETLIEEFADHLAWIWAPFIAALLAVIWLILRFSLRPLHLASVGAAAVGPERLSARLPETGMPNEILPLIGAVNQALTRLEAGYDAQRAFIADAAHELRTPLAVLKAHLSAPLDRDGVRMLTADVNAMERLVNQLLDAARLDALTIGDGDRADIAALAVDVAAHLAPLAIRNRRSIAALGAETPILTPGVYDSLYRAARNLVENALAHTPPGTEAVIAVGRDADGVFFSVADAGPGVPEAQREAIFRRFWRGDSNRRTPASGGENGGAENGGAGLGLSIVARTMAAHGGHVTVGDAPNGGALFTLHWPAAPTSAAKPAIKPNAAKPAIKPDVSAP